MNWDDYLNQTLDVLGTLKNDRCDDLIRQSVDILCKAALQRKPVLVCGNGGSAADSAHIAGELVGRLNRNRVAINCINLSADNAIVTACGNDLGYDEIFARQVEAYGCPDGVLIGLSTSGTSENVVQAFKKAKVLGMRTVALTGQGGGTLAGLSDVLLAVSSQSTMLIQQAHQCLYHFICEQIELSVAQAAEHTGTTS